MIGCGPKYGDRSGPQVVIQTTHNRYYEVLSVGEREDFCSRSYFDVVKQACFFLCPLGHLNVMDMRF